MDIDFEGGKGVAVVCRWNPHIFGACENTSKDIGDHWFILEVLDKEDYNKMDERFLRSCGRVHLNLFSL